VKAAPVRNSRLIPRWTWIASIAAVALAAAPLNPLTVERWYSTGFYAVIQPTLSSWANLVPFALLDVAIGVGMVLTGWLVRPVVRARPHRRRALVTLGARLAGVAAVGFLAFSLLWGLNYRRLPMSERLEQTAPPAGAALALGQTAVGAVNALYKPAHDAGWSNQEWKSVELRREFADAQRALTGAAPTEPGRLKYSLLGIYFRWAGVDGMVNPFALEVLANPDLLPFERPFVAAHEWAHLAGYAAESEASFVGWLTCLRGDVGAQYSGWQFLLWQIRGDLGAQDRAVLDRLLHAGPRADLAAIVARLRRGEVAPVRQASWAVYDTYLKANRVDEGLRSYGEVVTLVLRTRFEPGWVPTRKQP
jgi:hypothetical protein